eukprot:369183-Rhodomonas_salina.1
MHLALPLSPSSASIAESVFTCVVSGVQCAWSVSCSWWWMEWIGHLAVVACCMRDVMSECLMQLIQMLLAMWWMVWPERAVRQ